MSNDIFYKVLVIDDAFFIRKLIKKAIESKPVDTGGTFQIAEEAINGESGVQKYFEVKPDLVTLDINMPGINGIEVVNKILEKDPSAKILVISGNDNPEIKNEILKAGALDYIQKPFQNAYLWERLDKIFNLNQPIENHEINSNDVEINDTDVTNIDKKHSSFLRQLDNFDIYTEKDIDKNVTTDTNNPNNELENKKPKGSLSFNIVSPLENIEPPKKAFNDGVVENKSQSVIINTDSVEDDDILSTNNTSTIDVDDDLDDENKSSNVDFEISSQPYEDSVNKNENIPSIQFEVESQVSNTDDVQFEEKLQVQKKDDIQFEIEPQIQKEDDIQFEIKPQAQKEEYPNLKDYKEISFEEDRDCDGSTKINIDNDQYGFKHIMSFDIDKELATINNKKLDTEPIEEISIDIGASDNDSDNEINVVHEAVVADINTSKDDSNIAKTYNQELNSTIGHYNIETSKDNTLNESETSNEEKVEKRSIHIEPPRNKVLKEIYSSNTRQGIVHDTSGDLFEDDEEDVQNKDSKTPTSIISIIKSLFNKK